MVNMSFDILFENPPAKVSAVQRAQAAFATWDGPMPRAQLAILMLAFLTTCKEIVSVSRRLFICFFSPRPYPASCFSITNNTCGWKQIWKASSSNLVQGGSYVYSNLTRAALTRDIMVGFNDATGKIPLSA